jgi:hypothetical protein
LARGKTVLAFEEIVEAHGLMEACETGRKLALTLDVI